MNANTIKTSLVNLISQNASVEGIKSQLSVVGGPEAINAAMSDIIAELAGVNDPRARLIVETAKALISQPTPPPVPQAWWEGVKTPVAPVVPARKAAVVDLDNPVPVVEVIEETAWTRADARGSYRVVHRLDDRGLNAVLQELHHGKWETLMTSRQYCLRASLVNIWTRAYKIFEKASKPSLFTASLGANKYEFLYVPKTSRIVFARLKEGGGYTFGKQIITKRQAEFFRHTIELFLSIDKCASTI